jgi:hypothetical protein
MLSLFSFYSEIKDEQVKLFYKSLDEMGADADALAKMKRTLVCRQGGRLYPSVGWWYDFQKRRLLETEKAHHETMLAMMLLAQSPQQSQQSQQSQPQPWLVGYGGARVFAPTKPLVCHANTKWDQ